MKRITFTFLSCIMLAALLTAESIAAVRMNLSPDLSIPRYYTGVMQDLVSKNRERRKAFNIHEDTRANTSEIEKILKNKTLVSSRPASDAEKNNILSMLIATTITSPKTPSNRMTEDLNAAQSSNNPLDRHCYIVDMTEIFARELISQGKIESNFETFQAFSGVDKDRFLKLFYQVKRSHRYGLKIKNRSTEEPEEEQEESIEPLLFVGDETIQDLLKVTHNKTHPHHGKILDSLYHSIVAGIEQEISKKALDTLIAIANDKYNPLKVKAFWKLTLIASDDANILWSTNQSRESEEIVAKAKQTLINIANNDGHQEQVSALWHAMQIEKNHEKKEILLEKLIKTANSNNHPSQDYALYMLKEVTKSRMNKKTRAAALKTLIAIQNDDTHPRQVVALYHIIDSEKNKATLNALNKLIAIANADAHKFQHDAIWELGIITRERKGSEITRKTEQTLVAIRDNAQKTQETRKAADDALKEPQHEAVAAEE